MNQAPPAERDYYAVYRRENGRPNSPSTFVANVFAKDRSAALRTARSHGLSINRHSYAIHIGREGYFAALRRAFRC